MADQDVNLAAESSSATNTSGVNPSADSPPAHDVSAESSPAESGGTSLYDLIEQQFPSSDSDDLDLGEDDEDEAGAEAPEQGSESEFTSEEEEQPETQPVEPELTGEPTEEELQKYTPNAQSRIRELVAQRNEAREAASEVEPLLNFVQEHGLTPEHVGLGLNLMASLAYGDYETFLRGLAPHVEKAQMALGQRLPPDLQQKVDAGYITLQDAREQSQLRQRVQQQESRQKEQQSRFAQATEQQRQTAVRGAVLQWEQEQRASDPDYGKKSELVQGYARAVIEEHGLPQTPEQAILVANEAKKRAERYLASILPPAPPRQTRQSPSSNQSTGSGPAPKPRSLEDAVLAGLRRAQRR